MTALPVAIGGLRWDAAEAERKAAQESGAAERLRLAERPIYRPA
jgi:hypothetical protein